MSALATLSMLSSLEGRIGSNPKLIRYYPELPNVNTNKLLSKSLPIGAESGHFYEDSLEGEPILTYIFEVENENSRADLISLSFAIDKDTIVDDLKVIIHALILGLQIQKLLSYQIIADYLPQILEGLNNQSKITIGTYTFDLPSIIHAKHMQLRVQNRKIKGGIL